MIRPYVLIAALSMCACGPRCPDPGFSGGQLSIVLDSHSTVAGPACVGIDTLAVGMSVNAHFNTSPEFAATCDTWIDQCAGFTSPTAYGIRHDGARAGERARRIPDGAHFELQRDVGGCAHELRLVELTGDDSCHDQSCLLLPPRVRSRRHGHVSRRVRRVYPGSCCLPRHMGGASRAGWNLNAFGWGRSRRDFHPPAPTRRAVVRFTRTGVVRSPCSCTS